MVRTQRCESCCKSNGVVQQVVKEHDEIRVLYFDFLSMMCIYFQDSLAVVTYQANVIQRMAGFFEICIIENIF